MGETLVVDRVVIAALCRRLGVARLAVFGSAMTKRFDPARSDVDFLVEFLPDVEDTFGAYFGLKRALEGVLGRGVDLVSPRALRNPYFAESVHETEAELYAA